MAVDTLGIAIGSAINLLDLELVVVGGGLAEKLGQDLADRIAAAAGPWVVQPNPDPAFVASSLGDDPGGGGGECAGEKHGPCPPSVPGYDSCRQVDPRASVALGRASTPSPRPLARSRETAHVNSSTLGPMLVGA